MAIDSARLHGIDLKLLRVSRRVRAVDVARQAGWTRQRVGNIEAADLPGSHAVKAYLKALGEVTDKP